MSEPAPPAAPKPDAAARVRRNRMLGLILAAIAAAFYLAIGLRWSGH